MGDVELLGLRELEDDVIEGEPRSRRCLRRQLDARDRLYTAFGMKSIQRLAPLSKAKARREFDGLDPAHLVKGIAVGLIHCGEDDICSLAVRAADQRLVGKYLTGSDIEDWLKRHGERLGEHVAVAISLAPG